jgi:predicted Zn-dependent protease
MKNYFIPFLFLIVFFTKTNAQFPEFTCKALTSDNLSIKSYETEKNVKLKENEKLKFVSWQSLEAGTETEYIIEYQKEKYSMNMKDLKNVEFSKPANNKEFWEVFTLKSDVILNLAKNGMRYDLRGELDEEAIDFLNLMTENNLVYKDEYIEDYIQNLIYKIHPGSVNDKRPGTLNLIIYKESNPNAFCLPNGCICLSTGLLSIIESEDELLGVLSHEIAHFIADHHINNIIEMEKRAKRAEFWAGVTTALAGVADAYIASNNEYYQFGTLTYSTAVISNEIAYSMLQRFGMEYNHTQEFSADEAAFEVMEFLNKKPEAYVSALNKIGNYLYRAGNYASLSQSHTHPSLDSRLSKLSADNTDFYSIEYQKNMSFINTNNAKIEFDKKHYSECDKLIDKNIKAGVATEDDYIIKAMITRVLYGDKEHNLLALEYLKKAESLEIEPNAYINKQKGITFLRLGQVADTQNSFKEYLNQLENILNSEKERKTANEVNYLNEEISWTKRMIFKTSGKG